MSVRARKAAELLPTIVIAGLLICFIYKERDLLARSLRFEMTSAAMMSGLILAGWIFAACTWDMMLRTLGVRLPFRTVMGLHIISGLLNYLPFRAGTVYRARYLKSRTGLLYAHFASLFLVTQLTFMAAAGVLGGGALLWTEGLGTPVAAGLMSVLGMVTLAVLLPLLVRLPRISSERRPARLWNDLADGRDRVFRHRGALPKLLSYSSMMLLCTALGYAGAFRTLGLEVAFVKCLLLSAMTLICLLVSVTPAGIGVTEFVVGAAGTVVGVSLAHGVLAIASLRAIALVWSLICAPPAWLVLKAARGEAGVHAAPNPDEGLGANVTALADGVERL